MEQKERERETPFYRTNTLNSRYLQIFVTCPLKIQRTQVQTSSNIHRKRDVLLLCNFKFKIESTLFNPLPFFHGSHYTPRPRSALLHFHKSNSSRISSAKLPITRVSYRFFQQFLCIFKTVKNGKKFHYVRMKRVLESVRVTRKRRNVQTFEGRDNLPYLSSIFLCNMRRTPLISRKNIFLYISENICIESY